MLRQSLPQDRDRHILCGEVKHAKSATGRRPRLSENSAHTIDRRHAGHALPACLPVVSKLLQFGRVFRSCQFRRRAVELNRTKGTFCFSTWKVECPLFLPLLWTLAIRGKTESLMHRAEWRILSIIDVELAHISFGIELCVSMHWTGR